MFYFTSANTYFSYSLALVSKVLNNGGTFARRVVSEVAAL